MSSDFPATRLDDFPFLTPDERQDFRTLGGPPEKFTRAAPIRSEGSRERSVFLLLEGWVASSMVLSDGQRVILKFHLPGDMLGSTIMCVDRATDTLSALTPATVKRVMLDDLGRLMARSAAITAFLLISAQRERIALIDHLAWIARSKGVGRVASFFAETFDRLDRIGLTRGDTFDLPLTQEQIGDHLGLTAVHLNRILRDLRSANILSSSKYVITVHDHEMLRKIATLPLRRFSSNFDWLDQNASKGAT